MTYQLFDASFCNFTKLSSKNILGWIKNDRLPLKKLKDMLNLGSKIGSEFKNKMYLLSPAKPESAFELRDPF